MTETLRLKPSDIHVRPGFNPRETVDVEGLTRSVKTHGVLQPVEVRSDGNGGYVLIAGERRLSAAILADAPDIPAIVSEVEADSPDELVHAIIENTQREDLSPVEVAKAMKRLRELGYTNRKQICEALSISESRAARYEAILDVPEELHPAIEDGSLPLKALDFYAKIAKQNPELAIAFAGCGASPASAAADPGHYVYVVLHACETVWSAYDRVRVMDLELTEEAKEIAEAYKEAFETDMHTEVTEATLNEGKAYGAVLELGEDEFESFDLITDPAWLADQVSKSITEKKDMIAEAIANKDRSALQKAASEDDVPFTDDQIDRHSPVYEPTPEEKEKQSEARKAENQERKVQAERAETYNADVGQQIFERITEIKLTPTVADALVALVVSHEGPSWALRGLRYIHPGWTYEEKLESGNVKTRLVDNERTARERLSAFLADGTPEAKLAKVCQLMLAAWIVDERQVARTRRAGVAPAAGQHSIEGTDKALAKLRDQLVNQLTPRVRKNVEAVREETKNDHRNYMGVGSYDE